MADNKPKDVEAHEKPENVKKVEKKEPDTFSTQSVLQAELIQKATGQHPGVRTNELTLVSTYTFKGSVDDIKKEVKVFREKRAKEVAEEKELNDSLKI